MHIVTNARARDFRKKVFKVEGEDREARKATRQGNATGPVEGMHDFGHTARDIDSMATPEITNSIGSEARHHREDELPPVVIERNERAPLKRGPVNEIVKRLSLQVCTKRTKAVQRRRTEAGKG